MVLKCSCWSERASPRASLSASTARPLGNKGERAIHFFLVAKSAASLSISFTKLVSGFLAQALRIGRRMQLFDGLFLAAWPLLSTGDPMSNKDLFERASAAYESNDFQTAFELFMPLAQAGDADAMVIIASMYGSGEGVAYDFDASIEWGQRAAQAGSVSALVNLGIAYRSRGDCKRAKVWFERALDAGDAEAALDLAKLYLVSELENDRVRRYLFVALDGKNVCEESKEEAASLLEDLNGQVSSQKCLADDSPGGQPLDSSALKGPTGASSLDYLGSATSPRPSWATRMKRTSN